MKQKLPVYEGSGADFVSLNELWICDCTLDRAVYI